MADDVKFKFERSGTASVLPITGYWVYETPRGLLVDLYHERPRPTISVTHAITAEGQLGPEKGREVSQEIVREVLTTLEITPQLALDLGTYLIEAAKKQGAAGAPPDKVH